MQSSRRRMLRGAAVVAGFAAVPWAARPAVAQAKATKAAMQYQDQPKNGQECDTCAQYIPPPQPGQPAACKVVEGPISPKGWCLAYVKQA